MNVSRATIIGGVAVIALGGGAYWYFHGQSHRKVPPPPPIESVLPQKFLLIYQKQRQGQAGGSVAASTTAPVAPSAKGSAPAGAPASNLPVITSNARDQMEVSIQNSGTAPIHLTIHAGEIYADGRNRIVTLEEIDREIPPGGPAVKINVRTAALNTTNTAGSDPYKKIADTVPNLDALIKGLKARPDLSHEATQTAILALSENPPIDAFAKFPRLHGSPPNANDPYFKAEVVDIIAALQLLADINVNDRLIASDPQLKIEAMLDEKAHDAAMRYYGITTEMEWTYWKHELLEGDLSTRHYALYGIAQYYPDVALKMLPAWVRETRLMPIYRLSAMRALAVTHRQEAIAILQKLEQEFNADTDLQQSADHAMKYLNTQFSHPS